LEGAGTQTAGLAFGGYTAPTVQEQQKNMMDQLGQQSNPGLNTAREML
jgi:hypothetical protein